MKQLRPTRKPTLGERMEARRETKRKEKAARPPKRPSYWRYFVQAHAEGLTISAILFCGLGVIVGGMFLLFANALSESDRLSLPLWLDITFWAWFIISVCMVLGFAVAIVVEAVQSDIQKFRKQVAKDEAASTP